MQFSVPQFVEIEDRIIGPLTLKQFLILLAGGLIGLFFWSIFKAGFIFFLLTLPTGALFVYLAFGRLNGRPVLANIPNFIKFLTTPKVRVFYRSGEKTLVLTKKKPLEELPKQQQEEEAVKSRLKRLAYLLDQKTAEEERLIHSGEIEKQWLNQI